RHWASASLPHGAAQFPSWQDPTSPECATKARSARIARSAAELLDYPVGVQEGVGLLCGRGGWRCGALGAMCIVLDQRRGVREGRRPRIALRPGGLVADAGTIRVGRARRTGVVRAGHVAARAALLPVDLLERRPVVG